jgi:hypothetical protein
LEWLLLALLVGVIAVVILARSTDSFIYFISANAELAKLGGVEQRFAELMKSKAPAEAGA